MKKTIRVEDVKLLAKEEVIMASKYESEGRYELADACYDRARGMMSCISLALDTNNFDEQWYSVYNEIFDSQSV